MILEVTYMSKKKYEYPENLWDAVVQRSKELKGNRIQKIRKQDWSLLCHVF